jgi:hypothetical protein
MNKQIELTQEVLAEVTTEVVGVVELSDEMLQMVAGGMLVGDTSWWDSCRTRQHPICP